MRTSPLAEDGATRERLRRRYRPARVQVLFVGESPPASGRFFYQRDSGLYRAVRSAFVKAFPQLDGTDFLEAFRDLGCYLVDLCATPVNRLDRKPRQQACLKGEAQLCGALDRLRPKVVVTLVRSIAPSVQRAQARAGWQGQQVTLRYPGRWKHHQAAFEREIIPLLRKQLRPRNFALPRVS